MKIVVVVLFYCLINSVSADTITNEYRIEQITALGPFRSLQDQTTEDEYARKKWSDILLQWKSGKVVPEMVSSTFDKNGSWGSPTDGMQLSIKIFNDEFKSTEQPRVLIILRNLQAKEREVGAIPTADDYEYALQYGTNLIHWMPKKQQRKTIYDNPLPYILPAKSEIITVANLSYFFTLKDFGKYSLQVRKSIRCNDNGLTNIQSGWTFFQIVTNLSVNRASNR